MSVDTGDKTFLSCKYTFIHNLKFLWKYLIMRDWWQKIAWGGEKTSMIFHPQASKWPTLRNYAQHAKHFHCPTIRTFHYKPPLLFEKKNSKIIHKGVRPISQLGHKHPVRTFLYYNYITLILFFINVMWFALYMLKCMQH